MISNGVLQYFRGGSDDIPLEESEQSIKEVKFNQDLKGWLRFGDYI